MRKLILALCVCTACAQKPDEKEGSQITDTIEATTLIEVEKRDNNKNSIVDEIIAYYKANEISKEAGKIEMERSMDGSVLMVSFYTREVYEGDTSTLRLLNLNIPTNEKEYLRGDINNDGIEDMVITVNADGGGTAWWNDIFTFLTKDGNKTLTSKINSNEVSGCESGYFTPSKIEEGQIIGESNCWDLKKEDAHCCPTLRYNTTLFWNGEKLKFKQFQKLPNKTYE